MKAVNTDDCWIFAGVTKTPNGYGVISSTKTRQMAHRVIYENMVDKIPEGLTIDHLCRVKLCINPDHLEVVTRGLNTMRKYGVGKCKNGHNLDETATNRTGWNGARQCKVCMRKYLQRYWLEVGKHEYHANKLRLEL